MRPTSIAQINFFGCKNHPPGKSGESWKWCCLSKGCKTRNRPKTQRWGITDNGIQDDSWKKCHPNYRHGKPLSVSNSLWLIFGSLPSVHWRKRYVSLRIQVCPKKGITHVSYSFRMGLEPEKSYFKDRKGFLGYTYTNIWIYISNVCTNKFIQFHWYHVLPSNLFNPPWWCLYRGLQSCSKWVGRKTFLKRYEAMQLCQLSQKLGDMTIFWFRKNVASSKSCAALRIMGSQNWWFGDPRPLLYTSKPLYSRAHWFLGGNWI